jgi:hypothetical protein
MTSFVNWAALLPEDSRRRRLFQAAIGIGRPPIVVASMSRAGSTVLWRSVAGSWATARFGGRAEAMATYIKDQALRLDESRLVSGVVYKTHDLPEHAPHDRRLKVLFTYRKATEIALSIASCRQWYGAKWFVNHRDNLRGSGGYKAFLRGDTLGLEAQIDKWTAAEGLDVLGIRYDRLWSRSADIEAFLGFPVRLQDRKPSRAVALPPEEIELILQTYAPLDRKIATLPELFLRRA